MIIPLAVGAFGCEKFPQFIDQDDGTLIVHFPELKAEVRQGILEICQTCLPERITFELLQEQE